MDDIRDAMILGYSRIVIFVEGAFGKRVFRVLSDADRLSVKSPVTDYEDHTHAWFPTVMKDIGETRPRGILAVVPCRDNQTTQDVLFSTVEGQRVVDALEMALDKELSRSTSLASLVEAYYGRGGS
jgi:hypothetical protein